MTKQTTSTPQVLAAFFFAISLLHPYIAHHCSYLSKPTPVLRISTGLIQGRVSYSIRSGKQFWQFLGIPFAQAPVGKLRFAPPVPLMEPWNGVKQVKTYSSRCLQYEALGMQIVRGVEDCLFLNVFVSNPKKVLSKKPTRPVIVFIHGGGFHCSGSDAHRPDFFMDQDDIVLVTFNYRVGPLGFLNLADPENYNNSNLQLPRGNMGLKDQLLALKWIQQNIRKFGGDPGQVTIFGESAGAVSVHYHMLTAKPHGLFNKAISVSGTALSPWAFSHNARKISSKYVKSMGCPLNDDEKLSKCLLSVDAGEMAKLQKNFQDPTAQNDLLVPSIEPVITEDTILAENPIQLVNSYRASKIPWILGVTSGEGGIITARLDAMPEGSKKLEENWPQIVAAITGCPTEEASPALAEYIRNFYFGGNDSFSSMDRNKFQSVVSKFGSDFLFYRGTHQAAMEHALNDAPTYLFYYNYTAAMAPSMYSYFRAVTPNDWIFPQLKLGITVLSDMIMEKIFGEEKGPKRFGIAHADDLYQFWNVEGIVGYLTGGDAKFSDALLKTVVQFARNHEKAPLYFWGVQWPSLSLSDVNTSRVNIKPFPSMLLDNTEIPKVVPEPYEESLKFWVSIDMGNPECNIYQNETTH